MTRREAREQAFILVFEQAVREEPMDGILHDAAEARDFVPGSFAEGEALGVEAHRQEIDQLGLDSIDRRMLESIIYNFRGGPVGLDTLAATIGEEAVTLEDVYEPYLMQIGFLTRTPRGRCVTKRAYDHLQIPFMGQQELTL